jgi:hypothetical protein
MIERMEVEQSEIEEVEVGRKSRFDIVDLYEEMLGKRADMGFRPVLFVASETDLECNLIGLFERDASQQATGEMVPVARSVEELRRRIG